MSVQLNSTELNKIRKLSEMRINYLCFQGKLKKKLWFQYEEEIYSEKNCAYITTHHKRELKKIFKKTFNDVDANVNESK